MFYFSSDNHTHYNQLSFYNNYFVFNNLLCNHHAVKITDSFGVISVLPDQSKLPSSATVLTKLFTRHCFALGWSSLSHNTSGTNIINLLLIQILMKYEGDQN